MPLTDDKKTAICDVLTCSERAVLPKPDKPDLAPIGWAIVNFYFPDTPADGARDYWFCSKHPELRRAMVP